MTAFAKAFQKVGLVDDVPVEPSESIDPQAIPMMYRAQIQHRCSLMFAGDNKDLETWTKEWLYPKIKNPKNSDLEKPPNYCHSAIAPLKTETIYRIHINFPFRLYTDGGQDSIKRPVLGRNGIPFLPGSSVKGIFRRVCTPAQAQNYCGDKTSLEPGCLRFHGAFPVGNWGDRINDVVHPQEEWQIGRNTSKGRSAYALISLYKPQMVFEFSTATPERVDWDEVEAILKEALSLGIAGKTSTGYGRNGSFDGTKLVIPAASLQYRLQGVGVSSTLRTNVPEFRPNVFKAVLRGHTRRLLAGVCDQSQTLEVDKSIDQLFGSNQNSGATSVLWFPDNESFNTQNKVQTYKSSGRLYIDAPEKDVQFMRKVVQFAYTMAGFGKTWRRIWHGTFMQDYKKLAIGCHWSSPDIETVQTKEELTGFLDTLHQLCLGRMGGNVAKPISWRETWHPQRVVVYCRLGKTSKAVRLFHNETFKATPAIGGRNIGDNHPKAVSSVWHRMLPVQGGQYLEIVTVFHGDRDVWAHQTEGNQLIHFVEQLQAQSLELAWGFPLPMT